MKAVKYFLWGLVLLWAGVIFFFSSQTAGQSSDLSGSFIWRLCEKFYKAFNEMPADSRLELVESLQGAVRTAAHICEYGVLGILFRTALIPYNSKNTVIIPALFGFAYALSDEIHQYFVPGRAFQVSDVVCDTVGNFVGVLFVSIICIICRKIRIKKSKKGLK